MREDTTKTTSNSTREKARLKSKSERRQMTCAAERGEPSTSEPDSKATQHNTANSHEDAIFLHGALFGFPVHSWRRQAVRREPARKGHECEARERRATRTPANGAKRAREARISPRKKEDPGRWVCDACVPLASAPSSSTSRPEIAKQNASNASERRL